MKNLPLALIQDANSVNSSSPWIFFLDVILSNGVNLYLVNNNENITVGGQEYTAFPFSIEPLNQSGDGQIPSLDISISNITKVIQGYIEELDGALGDTVVLTIRSVEYKELDHSELAMTFDIIGVNCSDTTLTITLGAPNPLRKRFPPYRYLRGHCKWIFKEDECAYVGAFTACARTLDDCIERDNAANFGGYPGLNPRGVRLV
jgi:phage-related protein